MIPHSIYLVIEKIDDLNLWPLCSDRIFSKNNRVLPINYIYLHTKFERNRSTHSPANEPTDRRTAKLIAILPFRYVINTCVGRFSLTRRKKVYVLDIKDYKRILFYYMWEGVMKERWWWSYHDTRTKCNIRYYMALSPYITMI